MKKTKQKKLEYFANWIATPEDREFKTQKEVAQYLEVDEKTLGRWKSQLQQPADVDEVELFLRQLYKRAMQFNASAKHMELYAKLKGLLVEKSEQKIKLEIGADEIARRNNEAERRDREFREGSGYGVEDVSTESNLLPQK